MIRIPVNFLNKSVMIPRRNLSLFFKCTDDTRYCIEFEHRLKAPVINDNGDVEEQFYSGELPAKVTFEYSTHGFSDVVGDPYKSTGILSFDPHGVVVTPPFCFASASMELSTLDVGDSQYPVIMLDPSLPPVKKVVYQTGDQNVATVSDSGLVTAIAPGKTFLIAYYEFYDLLLKCPVVVLNPDGSNPV